MVSAAIKLVAISFLVLQFAYIAQNILEYEKDGLEVILRIQAFRSPPMDVLMRVGSFFGFEFFFFVVPLLAWWGDRRYQKLGINLFIFLLVLFFLVSVLKVLFSRPRPVFEQISSPSNHLEKIEYSFPSGHAWASMSFFFVAKSFDHFAVWVGAVVMSVFTIFSRIYFGVHYPHDTVAGMICGVILIIMFTFVEQFLEALFFSNLLAQQHGTSKLKAFLMNKSNIISMALLVIIFSATLMLDEVQRKRQQGLVFVPFCLLGIFLARPFFPNLQCDSKKYRLLRFLAGIPIVLSVHILYLVSAQSFRPLLSMITGVWIFLVAPAVFIKLKLTQPQK